MSSPDFLAYARTWTTCTYGVCQRKPCTVLLNSMGGRGFRDCWGANAFLQTAPEVSKPAGCFIPLEQHDQSLFQICCVCVSYLPRCLSSKTHLSAWDCFLQRSMFPVRLLFLTLPVTRPIFSHVCSVTAPLVCAEHCRLLLSQLVDVRITPSTCTVLSCSLSFCFLAS